MDHVLKLIGLGAFALAGLSIGWRNYANLADLTPLDGNSGRDADVFDGLYLLRLYRLELGILPGRRDPGAAAPAAAGDPARDGRRDGACTWRSTSCMPWRLSAADVRAIVDDPANRTRLEAVATDRPDRRVATVR